MRGRARIVDQVCLDILRMLSDAFALEGLRFAVAGGMGVQALLASAGLEHLLRATGDIGIVVAGDDARVVRALNQLAATHPNISVVQNPAAKNARVGPLNIDWINEPSRLRGMQDAFLPSIEHARFVRVRQMTVPVQKPEVLLAAKLTGQKVRPQDELDIAGVLQSGIALNENELRALVDSHAGRFDVFAAIRDSLSED